MSHATWMKPHAVHRLVRNFTIICSCPIRETGHPKSYWASIVPRLSAKLFTVVGDTDLVPPKYHFWIISATFGFSTFAFASSFPSVAKDICRGKTQTYQFRLDSSFFFFPQSWEGLLYMCIPIWYLPQQCEKLQGNETLSENPSWSTSSGKTRWPFRVLPLLPLRTCRWLPICLSQHSRVAHRTGNLWSP